MQKKRAFIVLFSFTILFLLIMLRVLFLQLFEGDSLLRAASAQRLASVSIEQPRGNILDRNGIPFTNRTEKYTAILQPLYFSGNQALLETISDTLYLDLNKLKKETEIKTRPVLIEIDEIKKDKLLALEIKGVSVIHSLKRYGSNSVARHLIGYLGKKDQTGQSGIEQIFEDVLKDNSINSVGVITDASSNLVKGLGYRLTKESRDSGVLDVKLTLDYHIQEIVEEVMLENNVTGAVVVEDVNTGDIVAMASKPDFSQDSVEQYLDSPGNELFNRAIAAYNLGSVFKIIDTAALMENNLEAADNFFCKGSVKVGNNIFKCSSSNGHGQVDLETAFALSCNSYFITMGLEIGYKKLINMAELFGLGQYTGVRDQGIGESRGNLPSGSSYYSPGDIANLSIGQGVMMATPLQVADIAATVANGGIKNRINIVDSIIDKDGNKIRNLRIKEGHRIIQKETADGIKQLMEAVTDYGTGTAARLDLYGGAAGKTGSAETGKKDVVHAWFAGYFPRNSPRYSIAVLAENGQYGGRVAAPIFAQIAEEIMKKGY
ncbi:MAG: penicillin-binding protein 2 [Ruminiclostridium sp.]|nr:penicillin-binding protein 2 [Ruminiclostridium sp.]